MSAIVTELKLRGTAWKHFSSVSQKAHAMARAWSSCKCRGKGLSTNGSVETLGRSVDKGNGKACTKDRQPSKLERPVVW